MNNKKVFILSSALGILLASESVSAMNMKDALNQALATNPKIKSDKAQEAEADAKAKQAYSGFLPSVDITAVGNISDKFDQTNTPSASTTDRGTGGYNLNGSITQNLFNGGATVNAVKKAKLEKAQALARSEETRYLKAFDAADAYIGVRRFQRLYRLALENIDAHRSYLRKVQALVRAGKLDKASLSTANSRLQDAITARDDIYGDLATAIAKFIDVTGIRPDRLENAKIPDRLLPKSLKRTLELTEANNKSVLLLKSAIPIAMIDLDIAKASYMPNIDASLSSDLKNYYEGTKSYVRRHDAKLTMRWNLFNGQNDYYNVKSLATRITKARMDYEDTKSTALKEARISWAERLSAQKQAESLRKAVKDKESIVSAYKKQFELGRVSLLDLLDAQNEYFLAKGSLITADATQDLTEARIMVNIGKIIPSMGVNPKGKVFIKRRTATKSKTEDIIDKIVDGKI